MSKIAFIIIAVLVFIASVSGAGKKEEAALRLRVLKEFQTKVNEIEEEAPPLNKDSLEPKLKQLKTAMIAEKSWLWRKPANAVIVELTQKEEIQENLKNLQSLKKKIDEMIIFTEIYEGGHDLVWSNVRNKFESVLTREGVEEEKVVQWWRMLVTAGGILSKSRRNKNPVNTIENTEEFHEKLKEIVELALRREDEPATIKEPAGGQMNVSKSTKNEPPQSNADPIQPTSNVSARSDVESVDGRQDDDAPSSNVSARSGVKSGNGRQDDDAPSSIVSARSGVKSGDGPSKKDEPTLNVSARSGVKSGNVRQPDVSQDGRQDDDGQSSNVSQCVPSMMIAAFVVIVFLMN